MQLWQIQAIKRLSNFEYLVRVWPSLAITKVSIGGNSFARKQRASNSKYK